jgi:hypothetical protein
MNDKPNNALKGGTPRPWSYHKLSSGAYSTHEIYGDSTVACTTGQLAAENAALIVQAVNDFDLLNNVAVAAKALIDQADEPIGDEAHEPLCKWVMSDGFHECDCGKPSRLTAALSALQTHRQKD